MFSQLTDKLEGAFKKLRGLGKITESNITEAMRLASAAGALACTVEGAQSSIPSARAVAAFLEGRAEPSADAMEALRSYCGLG